MPHAVFTSSTHTVSHAMSQQYGSAVHTSVAQSEQSIGSFSPDTHSGWGQLPVPLHGGTPHASPTSATQTQSHWVMQQYSSTAHTLPAQSPQLAPMAGPGVQVSWQTPPSVPPP